MTAEPSDGVLPVDYGRFNPRFLGVSFLFDSPDDYSLVRTAMNAPGGMASSKTAEASLHEIALLSVFDHEQRHYLDFLLSPYSTTVFRMRLQATINGMQAIIAARDLTGDVIPVPLTRWMTMPSAERRAHEDDWSELLGRNVRAVQVPSRGQPELLTNLAAGATPIGHTSMQEQFETYTDGAVRAFLRIGQLTEGFEAAAAVKHLRPAYIHEASALSTQLAAILVGQGELAFGRFALFLMESPAAQAQAWQTCYQLAQMLSSDREPLAVLQRIPTITTWALLGNLALDGAAGCPTTRLSRLIVALAAAPHDPRWTCDMDDPASIDRMWCYWDAATDLRPWAEGLASHISLTRRAVGQYEKLRTLWAGELDMVEAVVAVLRQLVDHQEMAVSAMKHDLRQVVDPYRYVQMPTSDMPSPDMRFEFRGFGVKSTLVPSEHRITRQNTSGEKITIGLAVPGTAVDQEAGGVLLDQKLELEELMEWCDLAFSELAVPDHVYPRARRAIEELTGKRVLQLF